MIYTIGHSTRSLEQLVELLRAHQVVRLADVRTIPRSRRHPHFSLERLSPALAEAGIAYRHFPGLGGLRRPRKDSTNSAWRNESFRGYADYMETGEFQRALDEFIGWSGTDTTEAVRDAEAGLKSRPTSVVGQVFRSGAGMDVGQVFRPGTAIMCAEALWWRCHRQLISDALVARGLEVAHIMSTHPADRHELTGFARIVDERVRYPGLV